jgi:hypothetical protein
VATGHPEGVAVVVSDDEVASIPIGGFGSATTQLWWRDDPGRFPDDGSQPHRCPGSGCDLTVGAFQEIEGGGPVA